jgi:hypothetical protein
MVLQRLPSLRTGEFLMLSSDFYDDVVDFQVRWLVTEHLTLDEKDLSQYLAPESRKFFEKYMLKQEEAANKPATPLMPTTARPLEERVQLFLNSARRAVPTDSIAENLRASAEDVQEALGRLVKKGVVEKGRAKGTTEYVHWLSRFGFKPSENIIGEVLTIPARISQVEATKKAKSVLEGGYFIKDEEIYDAEFSYIPVWRVSATRKAKKLFFFTKEELDKYYLSAETGAIMSLEKKEILFQKLMTKGPEKLKSLDDDEDVTFIPKLPVEVEELPRIKMGIARIYRALELKLGVKPVAAEIILLPLWTLKVKHKKDMAKRTIIMDAATGRILRGHFRNSPEN